MTDPDALADLRHVLPDETFVKVPRDLLRYARGTRRMTDPAVLDGLLRSFAATAWRLEVRASYGLLADDRPHQDFLADPEPDLAWFTPWLDLMREQIQGAVADSLHLPAYDFWIFDSATVAFMVFAASGEFTGPVPVTDPAVVGQHAT